MKKLFLFFLVSIILLTGCIKKDADQPTATSGKGNICTAEGVPEEKLEALSLTMFDTYGDPLSDTDIHFFRRLDDLFKTDITCSDSKTDKNGVLQFIGLPGKYYFIVNYNTKDKLSVAVSFPPKITFYEEFYVKDQKIFTYEAQRGRLEGETISIFNGNGQFYFDGDVDKLGFSEFPGARDNAIQYNGLELNTKIRGPHKHVPAKTVNYKCDGPLSPQVRTISTVDFGDKELPSEYTVPYEYCETNGKDFLTQYEFSDSGGTYYCTGGGSTTRWYKLYIKQFEGVDLFFFGILNIDSQDDVFSSDPDHGNIKKYEEVSSKKKLDELLQKEVNKKKIKEWDEFVNNIRFYPY